MPDDGSNLWGSAISAAASYFGQQSANDTNIALAGENREWQERMSNTAHQREVADLQRAGLNPMISAMKGGATTPSGSVAQVQSTTKDAVNSGQTASLLSASIDKLRAEAEQARATAGREGAQADVLRGSDEPTAAGGGIQLNKALAAQHSSQAWVNNQTLVNLSAQVEQLERQGKLTEAETQLAKQRIAESSAHELHAVIRSIHEDLDLVRARNDAEANRGLYGEKIRPYLKDVSTIGSTVGAGAVGAALGRSFGGSARSAGARIGSDAVIGGGRRMSEGVVVNGRMRKFPGGPREIIPHHE